MSTIEPTQVPAGPARAGTGVGHVEGQPIVGVVGLLTAVALFLILGLVIAPSSSLQILGSVTTFSLPILI